MSAPHGPNDPRDQRAPQGGQGEQHGAHSAPEPQWPGQQNPGSQWGQQYPGQPVQAPQWGQAPGAPAWGQPVPGVPQWNQPGPGPTPPQMPGPHWAPQQPQPQWNAPQGYPQQQYGEQPPSQWGAPPTASGNKSKPLLWIGIGLVAIAAIAGVVLLVVAPFGSKTLDQAAVQNGVEQVVTDSYGARAVSGVDCPSGQKVVKGESFTCSLTVDGTAKKVTVTFTDNDGTYEVSRPS
ncbi:DUF4333 domain-containing protein [Rhodococcus sp. ABRD24]|uniref:DUF4333 domain-containing protein n=1 Tax=Rhodococcus sp. ABRD24 TaxID=2507582 RepID=UPI00103A1734|nr:DUF4333 domain-containing protein [Rhodococcus sp. ABRD24]QBJ94559.1 DUF4333 domain-containing protein [Rhodococcus sp. ABRD24]